MEKKIRPFIDINKLNPLYNEEKEEVDDSKTIRYCPRCRNMFRWTQLIKTRYGWWTCPICNYRSYSGTK